jgi:hypothetical protein
MMTSIVKEAVGEIRRNDGDAHSRPVAPHRGRGSHRHVVFLRDLGVTRTFRSELTPDNSSQNDFNKAASVGGLFIQTAHLLTHTVEAGVAVLRAIPIGTKLH